MNLRPWQVVFVLGLVVCLLCIAALFIVPNVADKQVALAMAIVSLLGAVVADVRDNK